VRIISGKYRGRKLVPPSNLPVRPTTDFAREALFNVLNNVVDFESLRVLDLFCGTGSIAFEFLSRGAREVTAVDINHRCIDFVKKSAVRLGITNLKAVTSNAFIFIRHALPEYDLIFADPPYDLDGVGGIPDMIITSPLITNDGLFILEHAGRYDFEQHPNFSQHRTYGNVNFTFFKR